MKTEFINHAIDWYKGESIEAGIVLMWGGFMLLMSLYFFIYDRFDSTHQLIIPLFIVGLFWGTAGGVGLFINNSRLEKAKIEYTQSKENFIKKEKIRVRKFIGTYKYLLIGWSITIIIGLALFNLTNGSLLKAIGLSLILFAVIGLIVDLTSEQNAKKYYNHFEQIKP
ncbi:MAG: hypothetical protein HQ541_23560 [Mariniphaga sp.]|nr:hypothetical protein [Mariniphaga sp.]